MARVPTHDGDRGQLRRRIVQSVLADVFGGKIAAGERLVTQTLAQRFGVSHTPIREALIALSGIGIVDLEPNRGAVVRVVTGRDVREICAVRRALECEAARRACGRIAAETLEALLEGFQGLAETGKPDERFVEEARRLDDRLHDLVASGSGNKFLANELGRLKLLFRAFRDVAWQQRVDCNDYQRLVEEAREHLAIVQALLDGDRKAASRAMSRHITSGGKYWTHAVVTSAGEANNGHVNNGHERNGNGRPR